MHPFRLNCTEHKDDLELYDFEVTDQKTTQINSINEVFFRDHET